MRRFSANGLPAGFTVVEHEQSRIRNEPIESGVSLAMVGGELHVGFVHTLVEDSEPQSPPAYVSKYLTDSKP